MKEWTPEERLELISEIAATMQGYIVRKRTIDPNLSYDCADVICAVAVFPPLVINKNPDRINDVLERLKK